MKTVTMTLTVFELLLVLLVPGVLLERLHICTVVIVVSGKSVNERVQHELHTFIVVVNWPCNTPLLCERPHWLIYGCGSQNLEASGAAGATQRMAPASCASAAGAATCTLVPNHALGAHSTQVRFITAAQCNSTTPLTRLV
jgi:hypothetical protein